MRFKLIAIPRSFATPTEMDQVGVRIFDINEDAKLNNIARKAPYILPHVKCIAVRLARTTIVSSYIGIEEESPFFNLVMALDLLMMYIDECNYGSISEEGSDNIIKFIFDLLPYAYQETIQS
jgi:hypothetical protein